MRTFLWLVILWSFSCGVYLETAFGQKTNAQAERLQTAPKGITIDGSLQDWGDSLRYFNTKNKIFYTIANDKDFIYFVIRLNAGNDIERAMYAGITLCVNPGDGEYLVNYIPKAPTEKNIFIKNFKTVLGDALSTGEYNFKAKALIDDNGYLIYEEEISIKSLDADGKLNDRWSFHIRINGLARYRSESKEKVITTDGSGLAYTSLNKVTLSANGRDLELFRSTDISANYFLATLF